jgi:hypothetical protein
MIIAGKRAGHIGITARTDLSDDDRLRVPAAMVKSAFAS